MFAAYSPTRAEYAGTAFYKTKDGSEVEVTFITDEKMLLQTYLIENKDATEVGPIIKSTYREGRPTNDERRIDSESNRVSSSTV